MPYTTSITPLAAASRSASGVGDAIDMGAARTAQLALDVTAATSLSLAVTVETAKSATALTWRTADEFTTITGIGGIEKTVPGLDRYVRIRWSMTGTGTFGVSGVSVLVYCTPTSMRRVIASQALVRDQRIEFSDVELDEYAQDATDDISAEALAPLFQLPLVSWPRNVDTKTAELAVYKAMRRRGNNPEDEAGKAYRQMHDDVMGWCERVREEEIELDGVVDQTPEISEGGAYIVTSADRGWGT